MFVLGFSFSNYKIKKLFRDILIFLVSISLFFFISYEVYSDEADKLPVITQKLVKQIGRAHV